MIDAHRGLAVELRAIISCQRPPGFHSRVEIRALRRVGPAFHKGFRQAIGRNQSGARAKFDRHITKREAAFHAHRRNRRPCKFDSVAECAARADLPEQRKRDILRRHISRSHAIDANSHDARPRLPQRLRREHLRNLGGSDAERQRAKRAVRRGVTIAADNSQTGKGDSKFRPRDVDDALTLIGHVEERKIIGFRVGVEELDRLPDIGRGDIIERAPRCRNIVIGKSKGEFRARDCKTAFADLLEGVERAFMEQMPVDIQKRMPVG